MALIKQTPSGKWAATIKRARVLPRPIYLTFETREGAEDYCARLERILDAGVVPDDLLTASQDRREHSLALGALVRQYLKAVAVKPEDSHLLALIVEQQPGVRLSGITHAWADGWVTALKRERCLAPGTVRKYVGALARCLDWAVRRGLMAAHPLRSLPRGYSTYTEADAKAAGVARVDVSRDRRLEPGEEARILEVLQGPERLLFVLALETGMRLSELYTLDASQVDLARRTVFLSRTKNGQRRQVPLSSSAMAALQGLPPGPLFPWFAGNRLETTSLLSRRFSRRFAQAGADGLTFHCLRHEAICRLYERTNLSDLEIAKIVGHSSTRMLARYANLRGSDLANRLW